MVLPETLWVTENRNSTYCYDKSQQLFLAQVFLPAFSSVIGYQSIVLTPWGGPYEPLPSFEREGQDA
jgi:hypothetical protein